MYFIGGYLAEIKSAEEFTILRESILMPHSSYWIGLTDEDRCNFFELNNHSKHLLEGTWKWSESGIVASWTHWNSGEPDSQNGNEDCAAMLDSVSHAWIDVSCEAGFYPLCEAVGNMEKQQEN